MKRNYDMCGASLGAEDVAMMRGLLSEYCAARQCEKHSIEAEDAAKCLLAWFQSGTIDRAELVRLLNAGVPGAPICL
jgi:hypothetical protein